MKLNILVRMLIIKMEECIFCKIVKGEVPSEKVYDTENFE